MHIKKLLLNAATFLALSATCATAANISTYNRAGFDNQVAGQNVTIQNFDSIAVGTILSTVNGVTYGASEGKPVIVDNYDDTTSPNSLGSTSNGTYFGSTETATFTFATGITAFAIDINTFAAQSGDFLAATTNLGNVALSVFDPFPGDSTGQFVGFISDTPFTTVTISGLADPSGNTYSYTLDTLVYGEATATPEPATFGGIGLGLVAISLLTRRKRA